MLDVRTDAGLREALLTLADTDQWNTPLGRRVIDAVEIRARAISGRFRCAADMAAPELTTALVGYAWEIVVTQRETIIGAHSPWGVLYRAMARCAAAEVHAADLMTSPARARNALRSSAHTAVRLGDRPPPEPCRDAEPANPAQGRHDWDDGLMALHRELAEAGADPASAREAIASALDVLNTTTRRSHLHTCAYRDPKLQSMLGRTGTSALMNLLIGSRREGPTGSAWLALREAARANGATRLGVVHPRSVTRVKVVAQRLMEHSSQPALLAISAR